MTTHTPPYDEKNIVSIFNYSKHLIHKCLHDFVDTQNTDAILNFGGKGSLGQLVESIFFQYDINNRQEADFEYVGAELKCTPLKKSKDGAFLIKERLVCSMINYTKDWDKSFEESHFYNKCLTLLLLFYLHTPHTSKLDLEFIFSVLWKIPDKDLLIIKNDYETILSKIRNGLAHTLSEGDTMYLGACRKGQKDEIPMTQHNSDILAPRRAWSLKTSYMRILLAEVIKHKDEDNSYCNFNVLNATNPSLTTLDDLTENKFDDIILNRCNPYIGKRYTEICKLLNILPSNSKSKYFIIANTIIGQKENSNINQSDEFRKAGLLMKTIRLQKNGNIRESMSFENIDYQEVFDCDYWTDSRLYEIFSNRFLFVIFKETDTQLSLPNGEKEEEYALFKIGFWAMNQRDLKIAQDYWENIRTCVKEDKIESKYFWNIQTDKNFHVRPKARVSSDTTLSPNGKEVKKYCYWFNKNFVKKIIDNEL